MIVNTAYIYMGNGGSPVNPNLWQDGVSNYPVVFTNNSLIPSDGLKLAKDGGAATFSELRLTDFNSLTISRDPDALLFYNLAVTIEFFNSAGQLLGTETATFSNSVKTKTVNIPGSAKIQNAKIKMTNTWKNNPITLVSALLS